MTLKIVSEDQYILVVDKPAGVVVNRAETVKEATLQDELSEYFKLGSDLGIGDRAGIVHRLDRETSGLLVAAKTQQAFDNLQEQFKKREVSKKYIALVHGFIKDKEGSVEKQIVRVGKFGKFGVVDMRRSTLVRPGTEPAFAKATVGKEARTDYKVEGLYGFDRESKFDEILKQVQDDKILSKARVNYLKQNAREYSLLDVFPKTGRTHQIRVHLKSIGHFVVSDLIYCPNKLINFDLFWCPRLFLHASSIEFRHPQTKKPVVFKSDLPKDLKDAMLNLVKI